ncbi:PREDICTED: pathogenesis-related protein 5-like [Nicrophorus vespilloides]|uniref:Pathogenesis-related protein 5-like n=1 Tax=Nicrophorus vespilloides TaxID=110193 RepID=A0ABM1NIW9_NICVS|nr:PREDICTED: pathogenesis-related protein 5-like [Nicrophorus vespilloides]
MKSALVFGLLFLGATHCAQFRVKNVMGGDIWIGILTSNNLPSLEGGGFVLGPQQERAINAPDDWEGRFWARTWCNSGSQHCETGDCGNKVQCNGAGGVPPASLAEFNLKAWNDGKDYYDISLVDGYNVGVKIEPLGGSGDCNVLHCSNNLNDNCPNELRKYGSGGTIACESSCNKFDKDEYCCRNEFNDPKICNPNTWAVNSAKYFKDNCPDAYSYAYDDHSSLKTCMAGTYRITFG